MKTYTVTVREHFDMEFEVDAENEEDAKLKLFDRVTGPWKLADGWYDVCVFKRYPEKTQGGKPDPDRHPEFGYGRHWQNCPIGSSNGLKVTKAVEKKD